MEVHIQYAEIHQVNDKRMPGQIDEGNKLQADRSVFVRYQQELHQADQQTSDSIPPHRFQSVVSMQA